MRTRTSWFARGEPPARWVLRDPADGKVEAPCLPQPVACRFVFSVHACVDPRRDPFPGCDE
eukprot:2840685-Heterocapsa_arctica.AAC.1